MLMQLDPICWQTSWLLSKELLPEWLTHRELRLGMVVMKFEQGAKRLSPFIKAGNT